MNVPNVSIFILYTKNKKLNVSAKNKLLSSSVFFRSLLGKISRTTFNFTILM